MGHVLFLYHHVAIFLSMHQGNKIKEKGGGGGKERNI